MLFRFRASQAADLGIIDAGRTRRPRAITSVETIPACEKWRGQVLKEISRKVTKIQDPSLSDYQLRDLNDEINKLMREKWVWERQIRTLGGPNYMRGGGAVLDDQGREIAGGGGGKGYRYFGRARELPGVKEMFEAATQKAREERGEGKEKAPVNEMLGKRVDAGYYGWNRDEEDGSLVAYEAAKEAEAREALLRRALEDVQPEASVAQVTDDEWEELPGDVGDGNRWRLPTAEEVQDELVERRRRKLLDKLGQ